MNGIITARTNNLKVVPAMLDTSGNVTEGVIFDMNILTDKRCRKCGEWKDKSEFAKSKKSDGVTYWCKKCFNAYMREWNKAHPRSWATDKERERGQKRRLANPGMNAKYASAWSKAHPDKVREKSLRWRNSHLEEARAKWHEFIASLPIGWDAERKRKAYAANPEKAHEQGRVRNQRRRARVLGNGGTITKEEWNWLKEFYDYTCLCCGRREPEIKLTLDHVLPLTMGGKNVIENAQPLCQPCNSSKHNKHIDYRKERMLI